jgi:Outer membrane protein Omp28
MKKLLIFTASVLFLLPACEEKQLEIPELSIGKRHVLVEEMTGVQCQGCPEGTRELIGLQKTIGPENLVVVSIHAAQGSLSEPYPNKSKYDFRSPEIQKLADFIGQASFVPTASVCRVTPIGAQTPYLARPWGGAINTELSKKSQVAIVLNNKFDDANRTVSIDISLIPDQTLEGENRLTVLLTQDSIVDYQLDGSTLKPNYLHRHVLRDVISSPEGDALTEPLVAGGAAVQKKYSVVLPDDFVAKHCNIVAYLHRFTPTERHVVQVQEAHVIK